MTLGIVSPLMYAKVTGKTVGVPGSLAHTLSNENLSKHGKAKTLAEQTTESAKDILNLCGGVVTVGASAALATGCSNKLQAALHSAKQSTANALDKVVVKGFGLLGQDMSLKQIIKDSPIFQKFNSLPTPAKAGIAAGVAALTLIAPIYSKITAAKAGYIEGKNEIK